MTTKTKRKKQKKDYVEVDDVVFVSPEDIDDDGSAGSERAHKNIVLFSDGTGNSAATMFRTNVWRLYDALDKRLDPDKIVKTVDGELKFVDVDRQISSYDYGVGTSSFAPLRALSGAIGLGVKTNVCELYAFLCTHYEPGDRIYMFGFSRGA